MGQIAVAQERGGVGPRPLFSPVVWLVLLGLAARLVFLLLAGVSAPLTGDETAYQQIAVNAAVGRGFWQDNNPFFPGQVLYAWQAPLYPLCLALLYRLFGVHVVLAKLFGIVAGAATVWVTYDLASRLGGAGPASSPAPLPAEREEGRNTKRRKAVPLIAAAIVAVYPGALTSAHLVLSETLFTFLLVLGLDLILAAAYRPGPLNRRMILLWLAAGAVWGLATLTRGVTLYFVPPLALWLVAIHLRERKHNQKLGLSEKPGFWGPGFRTPKTALIQLVLFTAAMVGVIAPWTIRNYTVFHRFVPLETKGGVNFWLGNSPFTPSDFIRNVWKIGVRDPMLDALPRDEIARDQAAYALALSYVEQEPLTFVARMPVKFADFWGFERNLVDVAEATAAGRAGGWSSPGKVAADVVSALAYILLVLATLGGLIYAPDDRIKLLLGGFVVYFVAVHLAIFGDGRFHLPLIPLMGVYAGWFLVNGARAVSRGGRLRLAAALVLVLVFVAVWGHEAAAALAALRA